MQSFPAGSEKEEGGELDRPNDKRLNVSHFPLFPRITTYELREIGNRVKPHYSWQRCESFVRQTQLLRARRLRGWLGAG